MSGSEEKPVFVDVYGSATRLSKGAPAPRDEDDEHFIPKCWGGREALWKVFWAYGFFGSGVVMAITFGTLTIVLLAGLAVTPVDLRGGALTLYFAAALGVFLILPFLVWIHVSVWRCAPNVEARKWTYWSRGFIALQGGSIIYCLAGAGAFLHENIKL